MRVKDKKRNKTYSIYIDKNSDKTFLIRCTILFKITIFVYVVYLLTAIVLGFLNTWEIFIGMVIMAIGPSIFVLLHFSPRNRHERCGPYIDGSSNWENAARRLASIKEGPHVKLARESLCKLYEEYLNNNQSGFGDKWDKASIRLIDRSQKDRQLLQKNKPSEAEKLIELVDSLDEIDALEKMFG